MYGAPPAP